MPLRDVHFMHDPHFELRHAPQTTISLVRLFGNVGALRDVDTVQKLTDILVSYTADLLDVGGGLRDGFEGVSGELELVLDVLGGFDVDTWLHGDVTHNLLAQEVSATESIH